MDAQPALHPSDQTLHGYRSGQLDDRSAESVDRHLKSCPACRRRAAELAPDGSRNRSGAPRGRPAAEDLPPGLAENPDYEILRELGRGGMGVVYLARNTLMGREEVLKVVSGDLMDRSIVRERFLREIRNAAQLHHPNIVTAYSAIRAGDRIVLAMEYVEGDDLARVVKEQGPLPVAHACHFAYQAAQGLQHAHERGMIHRDIKPGNLMLARQGTRATVKILDFGLAKATQEAPIDGGLTREGQMLGTPDYIAPEQTLDAQSADIRADIYSLGCTLYFLLTGGPPFEAKSLYEILQAHHSREATPLNLARPEVPAELAALVGKMMAKAPEHRFQTPGEVARALRPFFRPGEAGPVAGPDRVAAPAGGRTVERATAALSASVAPRVPAAGGPARSATSAGTIERIDLGQEEDPSAGRSTREVRGGTVPPWAWILGGSSVLLACLLFAWKSGGDAGRGRTTEHAPPATVATSQPEPVVRSVEKAPPADAPPTPDVPEARERTRPAVREDRSADPGGPLRSTVRVPVPSPVPPGTEIPEPPPPPIPKAARVEDTKPGERPPMDFRHIDAIAGDLRPANPNAEKPTGEFWPILRPDDLRSWRVGDPERIDMKRKGVFLPAGPSGNLLLTRRDDYRKCQLSITLSATRGTEAFLALRAHRGSDGWRGITAPVFDEGGRIHAGRQSVDFRLPDRRRAIETADPEKPLRILFRIDDKGASRLEIRREKSSMDHAPTPAGQYVGAVGVFVKSGTLIIHAIDVHD